MMMSKVSKIIFSFLLTLSPLWAVDLLKDFDSLGGNTDLLEKLKVQSKKGAVQVVQKRFVDRTHRLELASDYLTTSRGNSYLDSTGTGASLIYHFNYRWSVGAKYEHFYNELTSEGRGLIEEAQKVQEIDSEAEFALIPELNWPKSSTLFSVSYYPIYGKLNIFNKGVVHFDLYATLGGGQMTLRKEKSNTYFTSAGMGFWLSQYLSTRLEYSYRVYNASYLSGEQEKKINTISLGIGLLL